MVQRLAVQILHGDEGLAFVLAYFVDGADIGMVESRSGLGFALKPLQGLLVLDKLLGQEFERYKAM